MKWRHWSILIVLVLLNYIIFSTAFTQLAEQRRPGPRPTRTPQPTFESIEPTPVAWIILPTSTLPPTRIPVTPTPTMAPTITPEITATVALEATTEVPATEGPPTPTPTPVPPTSTPVPPTATPVETVIHVVQRGETLSEIAIQYQVSVRAIVEANGLTNANLIVVGQRLIIPLSGQAVPTATRPAGPTNTPRPTATKPPTVTPTSSPSRAQFTGQLVWDPLVAPNCSGPGISKLSVIRDVNGNPVNGVRVELNCYDNVWLSHPSGNPGEYEPGHYDFALGAASPQDWTCTIRVAELNGQPVASSDVLTILFDTNDCQPYGSGHQIAIVNWTKNW